MNITISDIVALAGAAVIIYKAITLTPKEGQVSDASILEKYEQTINQAVDRGLKLSERIATLESEKDCIIKELAEKDKSIEKLTKKTAEQQVIIERLEFQIMSYDKIPVTKQTPVINGKK